MHRALDDLLTGAVRIADSDTNVLCPIILARARPAAGGSAPYSPPAKAGSDVIAVICSKLWTTCSDVTPSPAATGTTTPTRSGWRVASDRAINPPVEPPMVAWSRPTPRWSSSRRSASTMSQKPTAGKVGP